MKVHRLGLCTVLFVALSCGSSEPSPAGPSGPSDPVGDPGDPSSGPVGDPAVNTSAGAPSLVTTNEPPQFEIPSWRKVGVGQVIDFGIEVIDHESDEIRVSLVDKPASAKFDPYTLTVVWKPTRKDMPVAYFTARIEEHQRDTGKTKVYVHEFAIEVTKGKHAKPDPGPLGTPVETLITIHDPVRLAAVQKRWPLDELLLQAATLEHAKLPEAERKATKIPDKNKLYHELLHAISTAHDNPRVDPEAKEFDKDSFGDANKWRLIAVRPRLDKAWHELRVIYRAPSHEATYAMFKLRPTAGTASTEEQRMFNNKLFEQMVLDTFFENNALNPKYATDKKAHGKAVEKFMTGILMYTNKDKDWAAGTFLGLPCEGRLGGGSKRGKDGNYESGDAWGWHVLKVKPKHGEMKFVNVPIKGFTTAVEPSKTGDTWDIACAPKFDPNSDAHDPKFAKLCRPSGHVDLPAGSDGYKDTDGGTAVPSFVDSANRFLDYKQNLMVENLELRDPRRDLFEEKGMTCVQCHVRRFGVRDMHDPTAYDPRAGKPTKLNKLINTTFFVIVPTERWQPYAVDFQHKQQCKFKAAFKKYLGVDVKLDCPLRVE